jgi:hypothetical protein
MPLSLGLRPASRFVRAPRFVRASCVVALCALGACGGSSSESPWPVEPDEPPLGPLGEGAPGAELEDAGAPRSDVVVRPANVAEPPPKKPSAPEAEPKPKSDPSRLPL